jgi:GT2 family glycosyltransferase
MGYIARAVLQSPNMLTAFSYYVRMPPKSNREQDLVELVIIILNWNAASDTIRCVRHIASWQRLQPAVWVVDNGSTDGSAGAITRECPDVHLIRNSANLGFAGGNNRGIVEILSIGNSPILLLNNDAFIEEDDVIRLLDTLQANQRIGFVGPLLFDAAQQDKLLSAGGKDPARYHQSHILELPLGDPVRIVECVPGTVVLARAEIFRTVSLLDEAYFFASEVADLCMQANHQGYLSVIDTRARAFHNLHRSSHLRNTLHTYYIIRNRFLLIRKFHRNWKILFYGFWTLYSLALAVKVQLDGKPSTAKAVCLGLLDGLLGRFGGQNERVLSRTSGLANRSNHLP